MLWKLLKNVFCSALIVAGMTVASVTVAFVAVRCMALAHGLPTEQPGLIMFGSVMLVGLALLAGMFFSIGTLFAAALTMPPTIWAARVLRLPRPLLDMAGGGAVASLCVLLALEEVDGGKLADLARPEFTPIFMVVGVLGGALAGYVRHAWLVRPRQSAPALASAMAG
jgi:hypothetical protein